MKPALFDALFQCKAPIAQAKVRIALVLAVMFVFIETVTPWATAVTEYVGSHEAAISCLHDQLHTAKRK